MADGKSVALVLTEEQAHALGLALIDLVAAIRRGDAVGPILVAEAGR